MAKPKATPKSRKRREVPIPAPHDWHDQGLDYGLPQYFYDDWRIAWTGTNDAGSVVVAYTVRGWGAMAIGAGGRIDRWTDADSGRAGVGTCTDAGRDRCIAAAKMMLEHMAVSESWLCRQLEGLGKDGA